MENKRSILDEINEFLEYIGKTHIDPHETSWENLKLKFGEKNYQKLYNLCFGRKYIQNVSHKDENGEFYWLDIDAEGLRFLEEQKRREIQEEQTDAQNFLTLGILSLAIFSGILTMIYYYFDLKLKNSTFGSNSIFIGGLILLLAIIIGIIKLRPKKKLLR